MSPEQLKELEQTIAASFWRCNEMSKEQAEAYAGLAMNHVNVFIEQYQYSRGKL